MAGACVVGMCMVGDMLSGGHAWRGGACRVGETVTAADGTHLIGMHSCHFCGYFSVLLEK